MKKTSKMQAILDYLDKSPESSPTQVAKVLKGLGVTASYVSNVKCLHGKKKQNYVKKFVELPHTVQANGVRDNSAPVYASSRAVDIVLQARQLADRCGGYDELRKLLEALEG